MADVSNASNPIQVGTVDTTGFANNVFVSGNYTYIADDYKGLVVVDISNPSNPVQISQLDTVGYVNDVFISGNYAYIADDYNGLVVADVSNASNPALIDQLDIGGNAIDVFVSGIYVYVADHRNGLVVCVYDEAISPIISDVNFTPSIVLENSEVLIKARATDSSGISSVRLRFRINYGEWNEYEMVPLNISIGLYSVTIGPFNAFDVIDFYIKAYDDSLIRNLGINNNNGSYYSFMVVQSFDTTGPEIYGITMEPSLPKDNETIFITAFIYDNSGVLNASLYYQVDSDSWTVAVMELRQGTSNLYEVSIGPFLAGSTVQYYLKATDNSTQHNVAYSLDVGGYYSFVVQSSSPPEVDTSGPSITNVTISSLPVFDNETVLLSVVVSDSSGVNTVLLYYRVDSKSWIMGVMELRQGTSNLYEISIGPFPAGSTVEYYIQATDNSAQQNIAINNNNDALYSFVVNASEAKQGITVTATETSTVTSPGGSTTQGFGVSSGALIVGVITSIITFLGGLIIGIKKK